MAPACNTQLLGCIKGYQARLVAAAIIGCCGSQGTACETWWCAREKRKKASYTCDL